MWGWVRARPVLAGGLALVIAATAITTAVEAGRAVRSGLRLDSRGSIRQASRAWRAGSTLMIADRRAPVAPAPAASPAGLGPASAVPPAHFGTLPPGSSLPSDQQCATWVRSAPLPENKRMNRGYNQAGGQSLGTGFFTGDDLRANSRIAVRVDGAFTGTTRQILRWTACKWGVDEDLVYAQAAKESWWRQTNEGDWGGDPTACPPGHGLGVDGRAGQCPQSWGILQNRYPYERGSWPGIAMSTAMNADTAYAIWRSCFEGYETWLNTVDRGRTYAAGDAWGCVGRWFAGRWHTAPADQYTAAVQDYQRQRVWETGPFQEP
jgi:autotransporter family porin